MFTLYHGPGTCSLAVKIALSLTDVKAEIKTVNVREGEHLTDAFLKLNPLAKVPALQSEEGVLTEGAAMLQYIDALDPYAKLMPERSSWQYAQALKWLHFSYATLHPAWGRVFFPERYSDNADSTKEKAEADLHTFYAQIEQVLEKQLYLGGDQVALPDLYLPVTLHWQGALTRPLTENYPNIADYLTRLKSHPVIGKHLAEEFGQ